MTDRQLPENPADWPQDPYALFQLPHDATEKDLRRAYHRAIKKFRAEDSPEQFRVLTEQYEYLKAQMKYQPHFNVPEETDDFDAKDKDDEWRPLPSGAADEYSSDQEMSNRIRKSWDSALDGEIATAISGLSDISRQTHTDEDSTLRLFWLRKIHEGQPPFEVLERYLTLRGLRGHVFQMYLNEINRVPEAAGRTGCHELLVASVNDPRLAELTCLVWILDYEQNKLALIERDLEALRETLVFDHPAMWKELVHQAIEVLAIAGLPRTNRLFQKLTRELTACDSTEAAEWIETRWALVKGITFDSGPSGSVPRELVQIVRDSMLQDAWELRHRLELLIQPWTSSPSVGLATLDRLRNWSSAGIYLFQRLASKSRNDDLFYYQRDGLPHIVSIVAEFLSTVDVKTYKDLRLEIVKLCRDEDIPLDLFLESIYKTDQNEQAALSISDEIVRALNDDWPVKALIDAIRIFHE